MPGLIAANAGPLYPVNPGLTSPPDGLDFDPRQVWQALLRHRWTLLIVPLVALVVGLAITAVTPRRYQAVATVQIEQKSSKVLSTEDSESAAAMAQDSDRFLQTQLGLLNSKALASKVADSLNLAEDPQALVKLGLQPKSVRKLASHEARQGAAVAEIRSGLSVSLPRDSRIAQIAFTGRDPKLSAEIANSYVHNFISYNLQRRFQESSYALGFLRTQLDGSKQRLEESERAMVDYARSARLVDTGASGSDAGAREGAITSPTTANLVDVNNTLASAQAARIEAQERWSAAQNTPLMSLPEVLRSSAIQSLMEKRALAQSEYEQERQRRQPEFPSMQQAAAHIRELDQQINALALEARNSLHNPYAVAVQNEGALNAKLESLKSSALHEQDLSIKYRILKREVDTNRAMYDGLLQRYKEVSAAAGVTANNITGVDIAELPTLPITPKLKMNLATAGIAGLMVALICILVREKFSDVLHSSDEIRRLGLPIIGSLPILSGGARPALSAPPDARLRDASTAIRATLDAQMAPDQNQILAITSSQPSRSQAAFAMALARDFAMTNRAVLLVEADLRKAPLNGDEAGLAEVLAGECELADALRPGCCEALELLGAGARRQTAPDMFVGLAFERFLQRVRERYSVIIFNAPAVPGVADALLVAAASNATILVLEAKSARAEAVRSSLRRLLDVGATIAGVVVANADNPPQPRPARGHAAYLGLTFNAAPSDRSQLGEVAA